MALEGVIGDGRWDRVCMLRMGVVGTPVNGSCPATDSDDVITK